MLLVTIAIIDDVGAVAIIAFFYTQSLDPMALGLALAVMGSGWPLPTSLALAESPSTSRLCPLWLLVLQSGIHATIAGVLAAATVPLGKGEPRSPLERLEHGLHPWVMFGIVPVFGFVSAGVAFTGGLAALFAPCRWRSRSASSSASKWACSARSAPHSRSASASGPKAPAGARSMAPRC